MHHPRQGRWQQARGRRQGIEGDRPNPWRGSGGEMPLPNARSASKTRAASSSATTTRCRRSTRRPKSASKSYQRHRGHRPMTALATPLRLRPVLRCRQRQSERRSRRRQPAAHGPGDQPGSRLRRVDQAQDPQLRRGGPRRRSGARDLRHGERNPERAAPQGVQGRAQGRSRRLPSRQGALTQG